MRPTRRQLRETKPLLFSLTPALSQSLLRVATRTRLSNRDWGGPKKQRKTNFILSYGSYRSFSFEIRQRSDHLKTARQIHVQRNPLSSAEASFCCGEKKRAHVARCIFDYYYFYRDTQREPLRRREQRNPGATWTYWTGQPILFQVCLIIVIMTN